MARNEKLKDVLMGDDFIKRCVILAYYADGFISAREGAKTLGYTEGGFRLLAHKVIKSGAKILSSRKPGPRSRYKVEPYREMIIKLREKDLSTSEIAGAVKEIHGIDISWKTVERVVKEDGFERVGRKSAKDKEKIRLVIENERKRCGAVGTIGGAVESSNAGVFLFLPLIQELGLRDIVSEVNLHGTEDISSWSYFLSFLVLKLIGCSRPSKVENYEHDRGLGLFAGLNKLPGSSSLHTYSYNIVRKDNGDLMRVYARKIKDYVDGNSFNLDFHVIPFFGESEEFENNYISTRGKSMKSVLVFLAQDQETTVFCYGNEIKREEMNDAVFNFVSFWEGVNGSKPEYLIFDSKLTTYENLYKLDELGVKFVTLRRRGSKMVDAVRDIPEKEWQTVHLKNVKRKYRNLRVVDRKTKLRVGEGETKREFEVRELVITNHGRDQPIFMITNDCGLSRKDVVEKYAPRWRVEKGIGEEVRFFNLNALSSTLDVKVGFDIVMTQIASGLYKLFVRDMPIEKFRKSEPQTIFDKFISGGKNITVLKDRIIVELAKKKWTPLLRDIEFLRKDIEIPWLGNKKIEVIWT